MSEEARELTRRCHLEERDIIFEGGGRKCTFLVDLFSSAKGRY